MPTPKAPKIFVSETQKDILDEAGGDLKKYSRIIDKEAQELKEKYKGKFKKAEIKSFA